MKKNEPMYADFPQRCNKAISFSTSARTMGSSIGTTLTASVSPFLSAENTAPIDPSSMSPVRFSSASGSPFEYSGCLLLDLDMFFGGGRFLRVRVSSGGTKSSDSAAHEKKNP